VAEHPRLVGINHVALEVDDLDDALEFYGSVFRFELRGRVPGMAFLDMGDQFLALSEGRSQPPDVERHFGLVVDDLELAREALERADAELLPSRGLDFRDPWGNHIQVVEYGGIQFSKTAGVMRGLGLGSLAKTPEAEQELRDKGLAD
jgi:catechol 2,3-dioxygenase-like lactoylglutathione lyase family enzyme